MYIIGIFNDAQQEFSTRASNMNINRLNAQFKFQGHQTMNHSGFYILLD